LKDALPLIYLKQGEYFVSNGKPLGVSTILGSCVSVTFYCPSKQIGAITHAILPSQKDHYRHSKDSDGRFVDSSIECVVRQLNSLEIDIKEVEVKVFGGSQMYGPRTGEKKQTLNIGRKNVEAALLTLQNLGLRIRVSEVGGNQGRKVLYYPHKGEVWIKRIARSLNQQEVNHD